MNYCIHLTRWLAYELSSSPCFKPIFEKDVINTASADDTTFSVIKKHELSVYVPHANVRFLYNKVNIAGFNNDSKKADFYVVAKNCLERIHIITGEMLPEAIKNIIYSKYGRLCNLCLSSEQVEYFIGNKVNIISEYGYKIKPDKPAVHLGEVILKNQSKILTPDEYSRLLTFIGDKENQELAFAIINNCNYKENLHYLLNIFSGFTKEQRKAYDKKHPNFNTVMSYYIEEWDEFDTINLDLMIPVVRKFFPKDNKEKIDFLIKNYNYVSRK